MRGPQGAGSDFPARSSDPEGHIPLQAWRASGLRDRSDVPARRNAPGRNVARASCNGGLCSASCCSWARAHSTAARAALAERRRRLGGDHPLRPRPGSRRGDRLRAWRAAADERAAAGRRRRPRRAARGIVERRRHGKRGRMHRARGRTGRDGQRQRRARRQLRRRRGRGHEPRATAARAPTRAPAGARSRAAAAARAPCSSPRVPRAPRRA